MNSFNEVFDMVKSYCLESANIGEVAFKLWIKPLEPVKLEDNIAYFTVKSPFQKDIILKNYEKLLLTALSETLGFDVSIRIDVTEDSPDMIKPSQQGEKQAELNKSLKSAEYEYTFDTFIVGRSNEFAYAACTAVAKNSGTTYNPLFIHGPSGLGKTHLLSAISHEIAKNDPSKNIIYVTGEIFANELIEAIKKGDTSEFHRKYRSADVLLVDDIHFIAGKESTQEEFFHTFNELHKVNKQIVLTSDRPPKDIKTLEDRIRTRFEWGLIADISLPDFETRVAIIKRKAELLELDLSDEVAEFIANRLKTNIRQLEGAVKKLKAANHLVGTPVTIAMAQNVIREILNDDRPEPVTVDRIISEVANIYGVTSDDIKSNKRSQQISTARKVAVYVIKEITQMSLTAIGAEIGGRDHSTVVYYNNDIEARMEKNPQIRGTVDDIIKNISER